ncbi:ABC transporter permease [Microbacterium lushaniae]|uniref:ABC transporter permease n=1 Tax=Microbacterium lushaniae TaxID=2614639 RepID=A0A5J6L3I8_9MICO|nr:ABC transporter permease [Microbacterium lushaniae]QEW03020.1 ABC transporter permease [Microbacterium lushaniae]
MTAVAPIRRSQFPELVRTHAREVIRDGRAVLAILVSFIALIALLGGIDLIIAGSMGQPPRILQSGLGLVSVTGFMAVAFVITTVPLVNYRHRGILRQLATTPARRATFLLAHVPIRAAIIFTETVIVIAVALIGGLDASQALPLAFTLLLGAGMILSLGYLLAARMTNPDAALQLSYIVPMLVLVTSGALFPLGIYPPAVRIALSGLPTTWLVDSINAQIGGNAPTLPVGLTWFLMGLLTLVVSCATPRLFRWTKSD